MTDETGQPPASGGSVEVRMLAAPTRIEIERLATIFDRYRAHYDEIADARQTASWLDANISRGRLVAFVAEEDGELIGFAITMAVPASLRLIMVPRSRPLTRRTEREGSRTVRRRS